MILLLPCGGESSRFPGLRPKWLLTQPNSNLMVCDSITKFNLCNVSKIVLIAHKDHLSNQEEKLSLAFKNAGCDKKIEFFSLKEKTKSQPETVAAYLSTLEDDVSFFIKDCDGQFTFTPEPKNEVATADISNIAGSSTISKSYCKLNDNGNIIAIVEKQVISRNFCVGGYSFQSSKKFLDSYEEIKHYDNLYVSHVIENLILSKNFNFTSKNCSGYEDWGTIQEWQKYKKTFATIFLDIDGVIFKNSSEYFKPLWGESEVIEKNVDTIKKIYNTGRIQLILTTARTKKYAEITEKQLEDAGIKYDQILYGMLHSQRIIINDYSKSNPYKSCDSINLKRDSDELEALLVDSKILGDA
jgi:hypothetical protein